MLLFKVSAPSLSEDSVDGGSSGVVGSNENGQPPDCIDGELSPLGRFQVSPVELSINRLD